jgi:hypothetical protein
MKKTIFRNACGTLLVGVLSSIPASAALPRDQMDLSQAAVYNSPADIASWPVTTAITLLTMQPSGAPVGGLSFVFSAQNTWPNYTPPGWDGPLQYTVWAVVKINGQWNTSGFIQMWQGRPSTGATILHDFADNWAYDSRWGPMDGYQPQVGEQMGFFVSAGNARGVTTVTSVRERSNVVVLPLPANDNGVFGFPATSRLTTPGDFDGDGISDLSVYRPSNGTGYIRYSSSGTMMTYPGGRSTDVPISGDFDGDGKSDVAIYRPSIGGWGIVLSSSSALVSYSWGLPGDVPVTGDYDGDGKTDIAIYRPSDGVWYILWSSTNYSTYGAYSWGLAGDKPIQADYDGDGRTDIAVYRPSTAAWYVLLSSTNYSTYVSHFWGLAGDVPVPGDYDGDGLSDIVVFRPSNGGWYILWSSTNFSYAMYGLYIWGLPGDVPVTGDFDGDGKTDITVFRPSSGMWYMMRSSTNYTTWLSYLFGVYGDIPLLRRS